MRSTRFLMSALGVVLAVVCALVVSTIATPANAASTSVAARGAARVEVRAVTGSYDSEVLYWTNVMRAKYGLRALKAGRCADRFAERWTAKMAARDRFSHQKLRPILKRCHRRTAAENIAMGTGGFSAYQVVQAWMRSPGHRRNILNGRYKAIGISAWRSADTGRIYITQDFTG